MTVSNDQHGDYRRCHLGGAVYLAVEGVLWLLSATCGAIGMIKVAILILLIGGMFIHPLATLCSKLLKLPTLDNSNRLPFLNTLIALTIPLGLPLIFLVIYNGNTNLFFPAFTVLVGAHWLPFAYVYSMRSFMGIAGLMVLTGTLFGFVFTQSFSACGFVAGGILLLFAAIHFFIVHREAKIKS